ncbi:ferric reductase like transmembrane component domain-containing protein [Trichoderma barbatum]
MNDAAHLEPHWGYADRALPCTNDKGSCEYLDLVYLAHDLSLLYAGILWATIGGILVCWALYRKCQETSSARLGRAVRSAIRRYLIPESIHSIFGRITRLQVTVLLSLIGYLTLWSFIGLTYRTWVTPVKNLPGVYNTRTTLGPWSDRIGVLAYALTPLSVMLANRESLLSLLTGVPYQNFNFLHRWLGYVIFAQSALHSIGWCVIEIQLYQPQPVVAQQWISETYLVWGIVAMALLTLLVALSTPWGIRLTGYEVFRKLHYSLAMVYIGACWAHWDKLKCFMVPSLILWFIDRGCRFIRTCFLHYHILPSGSVGFRTCEAEITLFPDAEYGDIYRLDLANDQDLWAIGQHFYLCFPESSIWQSHPFTPLNAPQVKNGLVKHSYIIRSKRGETRKVAELCASNVTSTAYQVVRTTPVILTGPYGKHIMEDIEPHSNIICIAGGTGITYVLPTLIELSRCMVFIRRRLKLLWITRNGRDMKWVEEELNVLQQAPRDTYLEIDIFLTQNPSTDKANGDRRPDVTKLIGDFLEGTVCGPSTVIASGPGAMISDIRAAVAGFNSPRKVWHGHQRYDVKLINEDRMEL